MTIRVRDSGLPSLSDEKSFTIRVVFRPSLKAMGVSGGTITLTWSAIAGKSYRVQYKENLSDGTWNDLSTADALDATASIIDSLQSAQRFYRILLEE